MSFAHLHFHTDGSKLDGFVKIEEAIEKAKRIGQPGFAITDHGTMTMLWEAQQLEAKHDIKIVKGCEFYVQYPWSEKDYGHLVLLAKNNTGLKNLFALQAKARHNFWRKPRLHRDWLKEHHEGLICMSACLGGEIPQAILVNQDVDASINYYKGLFGEDFYLEVQPNTLPEQTLVNRTLANLSKKHNVNLVATADVHYLDKEDAKYHELLLAISISKKWDDPKRWSFSDDEYWMRTEDEILTGLLGAGLTDSEATRAIASASKIFDACNAQIETGKYLAPYPFKPSGYTDAEYLEETTMAGARELGYTDYGSLSSELAVIEEGGYSGYFLTVRDYIKRARDAKILVGPGRGSGGGSRVAYCNGITKANPDNYNLLFERFLSRGREPDIDTDFSDIDAVFTLLADAYGWDNVSRIIAKARFTAKNATRRVLGTFKCPSKVLNQFSKAFPDHGPTVQQSIEEAIAENPMLGEMFEEIQAELEGQFGDIPNVLEMVKKLQGRISHFSKHAGGVLIYPGISKMLPMSSDSDNRSKMVAEFDMDELHDIGHFKFDILGLETLPFIDKILDYIESKHGERPDLNAITFDDEKIYEAISLGDITGAFQIEQQKHMALTQKPKNFADLAVLNAIIRPGVCDFNEYMERRTGAIPWSIHEDSMEYMSETYGLMVYQEQYLQLAQTFAGWDLAFADKNLRKNKKLGKHGEDQELEIKWMSDCVNNNYDPDFAKQLWDEIVSVLHGGYGFNKSHAVLYAMICYWTMWFKLYYPECFYAALMTIKGDNQDKISILISEAKKRGLKVNPPNINTSTDEFTVTDDGINYRINTIKSVGDKAVKNLLTIRPIKSLEDLLERRNTTHIKKNNIINLIKAGCLDEINPDRNELLHTYLSTLRTKTQIKKGVEIDYTPIPHYQMEEEVLGQYLTDNPLDKYKFYPLEEQLNEEKLVGGKITRVKEITDKNGNQMAFVGLTTKYETIEVVVFASNFSDISHLIFEGNLVLIKGKLSKGSLLLNYLEVLD